MKPSEQFTEETEEGISDAVDPVEITLPDDFGMNMGDSPWAIIWDEVASAAEGDAELALMHKLKDSEELFQGKEKPFLDCQFYAGEEYDCDLLWPRSGVMLFTEENRIGYEAALQSSWTCFLASDETTSPEKIAAALKEE